MKVIPSISFREEHPVTVSHGEYRPLSGPGGYGAIKEIMEVLKGHDRIYMLDIDGIEYGKLQTDVIRSLSIWKDVWVDAAPREMATITDAYIAGADRVVISTKRMSSMALLKEAVDMSDRIVFAVDYKDGVISPSPELKKKGLKGVIEIAVDIGVENIAVLDLSGREFDYDMLGYVPKGDHTIYIGGSKIDEGMVPEFVDGLILGFQEVVERQRQD